MIMTTKRIFTLFAAVNLLVTVIAAAELWDFSRNFDRSGGLDKAKPEQKTQMLRTVHYWGLPPVILLTASSGVVFWRVARKEIANSQ